jgi:hypothetical protein
MEVTAAHLEFLASLILEPYRVSPWTKGDLDFCAFPFLGTVCSRLFLTLREHER